MQRNHTHSTRFGLSEDAEVTIFGTNKRKAKRTFAKLKKQRKRKTKKAHRN